MSKLTKLTLICCIILFATFAVHAEGDLNVDVSGYNATVSGSTKCSEGSNVTVMIVRPGKDISSVKSDSEANSVSLFNNNVSCVVQTLVDADNGFRYICRFDENEKSGKYTARVKISGETQLHETEFTFVNEKRKTEAEAKINDCTDKSKTEAFLSEYASDIDVDAGGSYDDFSKTERAYVTGKVAGAKEDKVTVFGESVEEINDVRDIKKLDRSALKDFVDKGDIVGVDNSLVSDYNTLSKTKQNNFAATFYNSLKTASTPDDVEKAFKDALEDTKEGSGGGSGGSGGGSGGKSSSGGGVSSSFAVSGTTEDTERPYIIEPPENEGFIDMDSAPWAITAVQTLADRGIVKGRGNNMFCPQDNVTREEFLKMVIESLNMVGVPEQALKFTDIPSDAWYASYVETGVGCGIIKGISETEFGTGQPITRQDMATILHRAIKYCEVSLYKVTDNTFTDEDNIAEYAKEAVVALAGAKFINGMGDGTFMPEKTSTRAEAAVMLYNLLYK